MPLNRRALLGATGPLAIGGLLASAGCFTGGGDESERLTIAMALAPAAGLSPHAEDAFLLARWAVAETLVGLDAEGAANPRLATDWTQIDDTAWEFTLRDDVVFHDGTAFDAETAARSLNAAVETAAVPRVIDGTGLAAEATGTHTLLVTTAAPDPVLPQRLSSPQLAMLAPAAFEADTADPLGHATGPFRIVESTATGAVMERHDDYWGEPAAMDGFDADYVPDAATRAAALRSGDADVIEAVPYAQIKTLDPDLLQDAPTARTVSFYLNTAAGPLADPALRAAVAAAIDPTPIVDDIYEGRADAPEGLFGPALAWAADHRGYELPDPAPPEGRMLTLATYANRAELPETLTVIASQLETAGFNVQTQVRDYNDIEPDVLAGAFDAVLMSRSVVQDSGDAYTYMESDFTTGGGFNIAQLADPTVDEAVAAIATAPSDDADTAESERRAAVLDAEAAVLATAAVIPVAHERLVIGISERVANVAADPRELAIITAETTVE